MGDSMDSTAAEALVQVLCVQGGVLLVGYAIGVASPDLDATLLSRFVASVSLPALLFRSVATLDSSSINYRFLVAMLLAKWAVASFAALTGSALMRAPRLGAAGLSALLATTGNELAFSLPVVATVLPHMTAQVLLLSAVQSILVNPVLLTAVDMSAAAEKAKAKAAQRLGVRGADELAAAEAG
jgi:predicted permease